MMTMARVNGVGTKGVRPPRFVIERNVLDMLEGNDKYLNLNFCEAQIITEEATVEELLEIYEEKMSRERFGELVKEILGYEVIA